MTIPKELESVLREFQENKLWGQVQLDFQRGQLVVIRKAQTIKTSEGDYRERVYKSSN